MDKVVILMSTYNGEKYLEEQLESLLKLKKDNFDIFIRIRDDGSSDKTIQILKKYSKKVNNLEWYQGENKGPSNSFLELLFNQKDFDYYAFCDQDDVWDENKVIEAIRQMRKQSNDKEILYFSAVNVVDEKLNFIEKMEPRMKITFESSFVLNPAIGCTMLFNNKLKIALMKLKLSGQICMHDFLIYKVSQAIGANIIYDSNSYINYRQHENNVLGIKTKKSFFKNIKYFIRPKKNMISNVSNLILNTYYEEISNYKKNVLNDFKNLAQKRNIKSKLNILTNKNFKSESFKENLKFKYDILFNKR